jgi:uncharacterized membrane protein YgaE (UPF0421/DUF939 family)
MPLEANMSVELMSKTAEFLQTFGGWGVSVIVLMCLFYLYRDTSKLLEKRNEQFIDVLRETTAMLQQNTDNSYRVQKLLERVERYLDKVKG